MSWTELSKDTHMEMGKKYKLTTFFERTKGDSSDVIVTTAMQMCMSNAEIEDKIYQDTGAKVKVLNRYAETERSGKEYSYNLIVEPIDLIGNPVPLLILVAGLALKVGYWIAIAITVYMITDTIKETQSKAYEEGGVIGGLSNQVWMVILGVVIIMIMMKK